MKLPMIHLSPVLYPWTEFLSGRCERIARSRGSKPIVGVRVGGSAPGMTYADEKRALSSADGDAFRWESKVSRCGSLEQRARINLPRNLPRDCLFPAARGITAREYASNLAERSAR